MKYAMIVAAALMLSGCLENSIDPDVMKEEMEQCLKESKAKDIDACASYAKDVARLEAAHNVK